MAQATEVTVKIEGLEALTGFIEKLTASLDECATRLSEIEAATNRPFFGDVTITADPAE